MSGEETLLQSCVEEHNHFAIFLIYKKQDKTSKHEGGSKQRTFFLLFKKLLIIN